VYPLPFKVIPPAPVNVSPEVDPAVAFPTPPTAIAPLPALRINPLRALADPISPVMSMLAPPPLDVFIVKAPAPAVIPSIVPVIRAAAELVVMATFVSIERFPVAVNVPAPVEVVRSPFSRMPPLPVSATW